MKTKSKNESKTVRQSERRTLHLEYRDGKATSVCIAGSFNDWQPGATPMVALGDGRWVKELTLPPGRHEYRLVVDGVWQDDPRAKETAPNPHGGVNAVITVG